MENGKWKTGKDLFFSYSEMMKNESRGRRIIKDITKNKR